MMIHNRNAIFFFLILFAPLFLAVSRAEEQALDVSRILYNDSLQRFEREHRENVTELGGRYSERLETLKSRYQNTGDLNGMLRIEKEQKSVKEGGALPALTGEDPSELQAVRGQYNRGLEVLNQDLNEKVSGLQKVYLSHLRILQSQLTRENRIDEALAVRDEVEKVESAVPVTVEEAPVHSVPPEKKFVMQWGMPQKARQVLVLTEGLQRKPNLILDRDCRLDRDGLLLQGGRVLIDGMDEEVSEAVKATGEFMLIAEFTPANLRNRGPGRIISYSNGGHTRNFTLGQQGNHLVLRLRTSASDPNGTSPELDLGALKAETRTKIVFCYGINGAICFRDGKKVDLEEITGDFSTWEKMPLLMGNEFGTNRPWRGRLHCFSIGNEALSAEDAEKESK